MLGDHAGRAFVATGVSTTFAGDLLYRFIQSPNFPQACSLAGALIAAAYSFWQARRAAKATGATPDDASTAAAVAKAVAEGVARALAERAAATVAPKPLAVFAPDDAPDPAA